MDKLPFKAEYAKSGRSSCKGCYEKIAKGVLRLAVMVQSEYFDGKQPNWHHEKCFFKRQRPKTVTDIGRLNTLKHEDQKRIAQAIENYMGTEKKGKGKTKASKRAAADLSMAAVKYSKSIKTSQVPVKKLKAVPIIIDDEDKEELENELPEIYLPSSLEIVGHDVRSLSEEMTIEEQNNLFFKYRESLEGMKKKDLRELLQANDQRVPRGRDECIIRIADMMAFGAPRPCDVCERGQLALETYGYNCTGYFSEWSRCTNVVREPKRNKMVVPERLQKLAAFKDYEPRVGVRIFECAPPPVVQKDQPDSIGSPQSDLGMWDFPRRRETAEVDPASGLEQKAHVYKDPDGTKWSCVLGRTDVGTDKNSYYKIQLLEADRKKNRRYWVFKSWGRIGTTIGRNLTEDCGSCLSQAQTLFEDKYKDMTRNSWDCRGDFQKFPGCYCPIDVECGEDEELARALQVEEHCSLPVPVQNLVRQIFDINVMKQTLREFQLDTDEMPLGKLSKKQITAGYEVLSDILAHIERGQADRHTVIDATNRFYTLVPHNFGSHNPPLLNNVQLIEKKAEMLDNLLEIEIAYSFFKTESECGMGPIESHYRKLKAEIVPLDASSPELDLLQRYMRNTHAATHSQYSLEIVQVFKVFRLGEDERFKPFKKLHNRRLLWHGSRVTNFAGILSQGLRIAPPEAPATGYMFGKGIYFADMVSKSANYCGTSKQRPGGVLLLCEVALGNMKRCTRAEYVRKLPPGKSSVWGMGRTQPDPAEDVTLPDGTLVPCGKPQQRDIHTDLLYNEFIVYDVAQVHAKYLFQVKFNYEL